MSSQSANKVNTANPVFVVRKSRILNPTCFVGNQPEHERMAWLGFNQSQRIMRLLKDEGTKGISKVFSLLLAAFAIMMVCLGLEGWMDIFDKIRPGRRGKI